MLDKFFDKGKEILSSATNTVAEGTVKIIKDTFINNVISKYARLETLKIKDKKLTGTLIIKGMEDFPIDITCNKILIADDGSTICLSEFTSNVEGISNLLNDHGTKAFPIQNQKARLALIGAKKLFC